MDALAKYNFSFYTIPVVWVLALAPRFYAVSTFERATKKPGFDNRSPRDFKDTIAKAPGLDKRTRGICTRAEDASTNGFENLGLYAAAVVAGNLGGLPFATLNALTLAFVGCRVAYNYVYVFGERNAFASARSMIYLLSTGILMAIFAGAGRNINQIVDKVSAV